MAGGAGSSIILGNHILTTGGDGTSTSYDGTISGGGSLTKSGTGTFTLTAANSYSGGTTIQLGTLTAASTNSLGTGLVSVNSLSSVLEINAGVTLPNLVALNSGGTFNNSGTLSNPTGVLTISNATASALVRYGSGATGQFWTRPGLRNLLALGVMIQNNTFAYLWN